MRKDFLLKGCSVSVACVVAMAAAAPSPAQVQHYSFAIPAQDLDAALRTFARVTRQQVMFRGADVRARQSNALSGIA